MIVNDSGVGVWLPKFHTAIGMWNQAAYLRMIRNVPLFVKHIRPPQALPASPAAMQSCSEIEALFNHIMFNLFLPHEPRSHWVQCLWRGDWQPAQSASASSQEPEMLQLPKESSEIDLYRLIGSVLLVEDQLLPLHRSQPHKVVEALVLQGSHTQNWGARWWQLAQSLLGFCHASFARLSFPPILFVSETADVGFGCLAFPHDKLWVAEWWAFGVSGALVAPKGFRQASLGSREVPGPSWSQPNLLLQQELVYHVLCLVWEAYSFFETPLRSLEDLLESDCAKEQSGQCQLLVYLGNWGPSVCSTEVHLVA